jgi:hypothetical protein
LKSKSNLCAKPKIFQISSKRHSTQGGFGAWLGLRQKAVGCMAWIHGYTTVPHMPIYKTHKIKSKKLRVFNPWYNCPLYDRIVINDKLNVKNIFFSAEKNNIFFIFSLNKKVYCT